MECDRNCAQCLQELCMHKVPLFASLGYEELKDTAGRLICRTWEKGDKLLSQGETPGALTVILKGRAKVFTLTADGREKILSILSQDDYFGELYLFGDQHAGYSVEALTRMRTCAFSREDFRELLLAYPKMAAKLVEELGNRVIRLEDILHSAFGGRVDARIAALLLDFSKKYGVPGTHGTEILLPLSREGMANSLGIARETLSRKLARMARDGILTSIGGKRVRILRPDLLEVQAQGEEEYKGVQSP